MKRRWKWIERCGRLTAVLLFSCAPNAMQAEARGPAESDVSLPTTPVQLDEQHPLLTVTTWRVVGPFRLPDKLQSYTFESERFGLTNDFLAERGGSEIPLSFGEISQTQLPVDFLHDPNDEIQSHTRIRQFNQVVSFPMPDVSSYILFRRSAEFFKVMYASAILDSPREQDVVLIVGANSPLRLVLNNKILVDSAPRMVGHDQDVSSVKVVHLLRGPNRILIKLFCFPKRNEFAVRIASVKGADAFIADHGGLRDVLDQAFVPLDGCLRLSGNLTYFFRPPADQAQVVISEATGHVDYKGKLSPALTVPTPLCHIGRGLHTIRITFPGNNTFSENFYVGNSFDAFADIKRLCEPGPGAMHPGCALFATLSHLLSGHHDTSRLDWQKRALYLIEVLANSLRRHAPESNRLTGGTRLVTYTSSVDGQVQYSLAHIPAAYDGIRPLPLVIYVLHNTLHESFLDGPTTKDIDWLLKLDQLSEKHKMLWLISYARGIHNNVPLGIEDTLEALNMIEAKYRIDPSRVYLVSECGGARNALNLAEAFPDKFAALSLVNTSLSDTRNNGFWRDANDVLLSSGNLSNIALQLIHGKSFPHSPIQQSYRLYARCQGSGFSPTFVTLEGDGRWADRDIFGLSFDFFERKHSASHPNQVQFATGQLKHDSAYWLRIGGFEHVAQMSRVEGIFTSPNRFVLTTDNVAQIVLRGDFLRAKGLQGRFIRLDVNGVARIVRVSSSGADVVVPITKTVSTPIHKTKEREGPIADVFAHPFLIVEGSQGTESDLASVKNVSSALVNSWREWYGVACLRKMDRDVTEADWARSSLVIIGTAETNSILRKIAPSLPIHVAAEGIEVGGQRFTGPSLTAIVAYPNPLNSARYVLIVTANSLQRFAIPTPALSVYGRFDAMIWSTGNDNHSALIGAGYWDNDWQHMSRLADRETIDGKSEDNNSFPSGAVPD